ncbi:hypothetical protein [Mycoplasma parvum]|uniref:Uncharacterized protein n=1 Tax=Mycoplasma parvum str. Indiana TaxID=1403316 RepID=U5NF54_9MOLU|nr:hypothetical protein [Mycoplasma parvum]AGX88799.1 hypothetical protein PRV_00035 [Mycoplasma parvum str. Indiana]
MKKFLSNYVTIYRTLMTGKALVIETDTQIALVSLNKNLLYEMKKRPLKKN